MSRSCFGSFAARTARRLCLAGWMIAVAGSSLAAAGDQDRMESLWQQLLAASRQARLQCDQAHQQWKQEAGVQLGEWHYIGPFKDTAFGIARQCFDTPFAPEKDVLAAGRGPVDLDRTYEASKFPGMLETKRVWQRHPEWIDGYRHLLPRGPSPSRNESCYLFRTITAKKDVTLSAVLRTEDYARVWLNGVEVAEFESALGLYGWARVPKSQPVSLELKAGGNRLLVKLTSVHNAHGLAFNVAELTGLTAPDEKDLAAVLSSTSSRFTPGNEPFASAKRFSEGSAAWAPLDPPYYVKKPAWRETLLASLEARREQMASGQGGFVPFVSKVIRQQDPPEPIRIPVSGLKQLWLITTIGGDNMDKDDSIWADPKLITADGKEVRLSDLKPLSAKVGWRELFVNKNYEGKPLTVGGRTFAHGFWAHAPSEVGFALDGRYQWFETTIGLDSLATASGSVEFKILDAPESADAVQDLWKLLARDFPDEPARTEIFWERKDGIWEGLDSEASDGRPVLYDRYAEALMRVLRLPQEAVDQLPQPQEAASVEIVRQLYHRARRYAGALARLREFLFDVAPMPLYDPPQLRMHKLLERSVPHSPEARAYLERLAALRSAVQEALSAVERGEPGAAEAAVRAAEAIEAMWRGEMHRLPPILFIRAPRFEYGGFGPYEWGGARPASICLFDPARPDQPARVIYEDPAATIFDMTLSYDARTIFFSARSDGAQGGWHIYEIGIDGKNLRQITHGESSNISPVLLPNGQIMFVSTRSGSFAQCQPVHSGHLFVMNRDGTNVRKVSANIDSDHSPQVLNDGRVLFSRWDYGIEKNVFSRQALWAMNPDGTGLELFFGNTIEDPCSFWTGVAIPRRPEVVCVFGPHHGAQAGSVGLVWNRLGPETPRGEGFRWVTRELPSHGDISFSHGYSRPFPVHECLFVVSYGGDGQMQNRLYLLDDRGNKKCIYEDAQLGCWNPLLVRPREVPPVVVPRCENPQFVYRDVEQSNRGPDDGPTATLAVQDVYQGVSSHIRRGEVGYIQVMEQVQKSRPRHPVTAWSTVAPIIGRGTQHVRRLVGVVPVEPDGSAHFVVPALRSISLNLLDGDGKVLMAMGSDMHVMPEEKRSCIGCHETRHSDGLPPSGRAVAPPSPAWQASLAARRPPSIPQRPDWGTYGIIDFSKVIQPVLDKHCVKCHSGPTPDAALDLSGDKTRFFNMAYDNLIERLLVDWFSPFAQSVDENTPKMHGALISRLREYIDTDKHYGAKLSLEERQRIYAWIDANVPYYGSYAHNRLRAHRAGARDGWDIANPQGWFQKDLKPVFERRCLECHRRTVCAQTAFYGTRIPVTSRIWTEQALNEHALWCGEQVETFLIGPELRINLTHPEWSLMLTAPLAEQAGGLGLCKTEDGTPYVFKDAADSDYQRMLTAICQGREELLAYPRADMIELYGRPPPQPATERDPLEITGVTIRAVSSQLVGTAKWGQPLDRGASRLVDSSGLGQTPCDDFGCAVPGASPGFHSNNPDGTSWSSAGIGYSCGFEDDDPSPWIIFDLGGLCDLERVRVWNYNERGGYSKRGVKDLEILVSADGNSYVSLGRFALARAPEAEDVDFSQSLSMEGKAEQVGYVKFQILTNHNRADYQKGVPGPDWSMVGLSEVKFYRPAGRPGPDSGTKPQ